VAFLLLRHPIREVDHAHHLVERGHAGAHQPHAVVGERLEAVGARRGEDLARRGAPRDELVNLLEFEEEAKKKLPPATFALIAGGDRALFDRSVESVFRRQTR